MQLTLEQVMPEPPEIGIADASFQRARTGGDGIGLTRHGKGSILQVIVNLDSLPSSVLIASAGSPGESRLLAESITDNPKILPRILIGDKAYDTDYLRELCDQHDTFLVSKPRKGRVDYTERLSEYEKLDGSIRIRWPVERLFAWLTAYRGVVTRYARTLHNHAQATYLALAQIIVSQTDKRGFSD